MRHLLSFHFIVQFVVALVSVEYSALRALYDTTDGSNWNWKDETIHGPRWNFTDDTIDPCSPIAWQGVTCNSSTSACASLPCSVSELNLGSTNLNGVLPSSISNLSIAHNLLLSKNCLGGVIPRSLCEMTNLVLVQFHDNLLSGDIPDCIGTELLALEEIWLFRNRLEGTIPSSLGGLLNIRYFSVGVNCLWGTIPEELYSLTKLTNLQLYSNVLTGSISSKVANLVNLERMYLMDNLLSHSIPSSIGEMTALIDVYLYQNALTGSIPRALCNLSSVLAFAIMNNLLSNEIPDCLLLPKATYQDISANLLSGSIPRSFGNNISAVNFLYLDYNFFTGTLPDSIADITRLSVFFADKNELGGTIPESFSLITYLSLIDLSINHFYGTIPSFLYGFSRLKSISLWENLFTGTLSPSIAQLSHTMELVLLNSNSLDGSIPSEIGLLTKLTSFQIQKNCFTGTIPTSLGTTLQPMGLLQQFIVGYNFLTGSLPPSLGNLGKGKLRTMSIRNNALSGTLPASLLSAMQELTVLELCDNQFSGTLPSSMGSLSSLETLLLQKNHFRGKPTNGISASMPLLTAVDISENEFTGSLPSVLFGFKYVSTVAAAKNCFSGKLPSNICQPTALVSLVLDGLSSGEACIDKIPYTPSYWIANGVDGEIPSCLLTDSPFLTLLHASGNLFSGKFLETDITNITSNLRTLVVAHNRLTGTISKSIQQRPFSLLDASYNRITGGVDHFGADNIIFERLDEVTNITVRPGTTTIKLNENRLSGKLPGAFRTASDVNVLSGNLFQCEADTTPHSDPASNEYICGSDDVDSAIVAWGVLAAVVVLLYVALLLSLGPKSQLISVASIRNVVISQVATAKEWFSIPHDLSLSVRNDSISSTAYAENNYSGVETLRFLNHMCKYRDACLFISAMVILIYGPLCVLVKRGVFSGAYGTYTYQATWVYSALFQEGVTAEILWLMTWCIIIVVYVVCNLPLLTREAKGLGTPDAKDRRTDSKGPIADASWLTSSDCMKFTFTIVFNCCLVLGINLAYVYGMLADSSSYSFKIGLRLLLICFNSVWSNGAIYLVYKVYPQEIRQLRSHSIVNLLLIIVPIFNNILAPLISSALLDDSCFKRLLSGQDDIIATYTYLKCSLSLFEIYDNGESSISCLKIEPTGIITTTFESSFSYSYACSSSLLKIYLPVLIAGYLVKCFVAPLIYLSFLLVGKQKIPKSVIERVPAIIFPDLVKYKSSSEGDVDSIFYIFDAIKVIALMRNHLTVLLTFGLASPPLAAAICTTMTVQTVLWRILVGRYLLVSKNCDSCELEKISLSGDISFSDINDDGSLIHSVVNMTPLHSDSPEINVVTPASPPSDFCTSDHGVPSKRTESFGPRHSVTSASTDRTNRFYFSHAHVLAMDYTTAQSCLAVSRWVRLTLLVSLLFSGWVVTDMTGDVNGLKDSIWIFVVMGVTYLVANIVISNVLSLVSESLLRRFGA